MNLISNYRLTVSVKHLLKSKLFLILTLFFILTIITHRRCQEITLKNESKTIANKIFQENQIYEEKSVKILCIILTSERSIINRSIPVWNFWGKKCDKTFFACNCANFTKIMQSKQRFTLFNNMRTLENALELPILQLNITESYKSMAEKVFEVLKQVYEANAKNYKWFLLTDDDTYIFYNNLKLFISNKSFTEPYTYGYNFKVIIPSGYHSGGAGILFTLESLKRITNSIRRGICNQTKGHGDLALGRCAYQSNITMGKSLDELGRERFHPLSFHSHYKGNIPTWLFKYSSNDVKIGNECCSDETISFHYTSADQMNFFDNLANKKLIKAIYNIF